MLWWSASSADQLAHERQQRLVASVLAKSGTRIAYDQESVTVWDDAIIQLRRPRLDEEWLDNNLGIWLHDYYGHSAAYVLSPEDVPVHAMIGGQRRAPGDFNRVRAQLLPIVSELRAGLRAGSEAIQSADQQSPGVADLMMLDGDPAIVSAKPIISDSGHIEQVPGRQFVHVSVRRLDDSFAAELREEYGLDAGRMARVPTTRWGESSHALRARNGDVVGYFTWRSFAPGASVFSRTAPVLLMVFAVLGAAAFLMMRRLASGARKLRESNATVQHLAFHDPLTGLPNRALFEDRLEHALAIYRRTVDRKAALLFIDLDRFKLVNDSLGHAAGDQLLCEFATRLKGSVRASDTVARLGGDEFAIIQEDVGSAAEIEALCQRIVGEAARPFLVSGSQAHIGASIGVAISGKDGQDMAELARKADIALYESKAQGRGQFQLFSPPMEEPIRARQNLERDLREALAAGDQLSVVYQPAYSSRTGALVGVEALVRWMHPEAGSIPPAVFVPIAEETGLIEPLGEWVMACACREAAAWPIETVAINVSPVQLRKPHFASRAIAIISDAGIDPGRIELEITETAMLDDAAQCATNLRLLKKLGLRIALDDFGTGYSSFRHFNEFEVDRVKIDRSFVDRINMQDGGSAIIQAMIDLARSSGFQTTAEGVETDEQKAFLEQIGCDELQGFLLARPSSASELDELFGNVSRLDHQAAPRAAAPRVQTDPVERKARS
jgi:diguanylate cyclase (GGDEF)-like protein